MSQGRLYTVADAREIDRKAVEEHGIDAYELMQRAGDAAFSVLRARYGGARTLAVLTGSGNNAGDGFVLARLARDAFAEVRVIGLRGSQDLEGSAAQAASDHDASGGQSQAFTDALPEADVYVDALMGTGLSRPLEGAYRAVVDQLNRSGKPVLALDVPTGIHADTGAVMGAAIRADATVSFICHKRGLFTGPALDHTGSYRLAPLSVPEEAFAGLTGTILLDRSALRGVPRRPRHSHKGRFGTVLCVGGNEGMAGSIQLSGVAALRIGAGAVRVATRATHAGLVSLSHPELMSAEVEDPTALRSLLDRTDVLVLGPGLGSDSWAEECFDAALEFDGPTVVDADGLNMLAGKGGHHTNWILTPHPGEAGRLLGTSAADVESDRFAAIHELIRIYGGQVVLKGGGTLIAGDDRLALSPHADPCMAIAGMGDVLTGVVAGLLAQGASPRVAAEAGVMAHALAAKHAAAGSDRGVFPTELAAALPLLFR